MAEHYAGNNLVVEFAGTDISTYIRSVDVSETNNTEWLDSTHKGDTTKQYVRGIPGPETTISYGGLDIYDSLHVLGTLAMNTLSTVVVYPYGKTHTYPMLTLQYAIHESHGQPIAYNAVTELSGEFHAKNTLTRSTYSSA